jgi:hypothetical protein
MRYNGTSEDVLPPTSVRAVSSAITRKQVVRNWTKALSRGVFGTESLDTALETRPIDSNLYVIHTTAELGMREYGEYNI